jgi:hypothetical protein
MSVFNEIFSKEVEKKMYDSNSYLSHMKNMTDFLQGRTVHVPNYTHDSSAQIEVNGSTYDFDATQTTEVDLTFNIDSYRILPFQVTNFDELSTNYNKFQVVTEHAIADLTDVVSKHILNKLADGVDTPRKVFTSGAVSGTGNSADNSVALNTISYKDILGVAQKMNEDNLPQDGRFLLLDATMYNELLQDDAIRNANNFGQATLPSGVVNKIAGVNIMLKNVIATADSVGGINPVGQAPIGTDLRAGLAWHQSVVMTAKSGTQVYTDTSNPFKFGSVVSSEIFMGAVNPRTDLKGTYLIVQA